MQPGLLFVVLLEGTLTLTIVMYVDALRVLGDLNVINFSLQVTIHLLHLTCLACGGELVATDQWQTLRSPPGKDVHCYWRITVSQIYFMEMMTFVFQAPEGNKVRFRLSDGEFPCSYGCQSYVEIKHKLDVRLTGFRR